MKTYIFQSGGRYTIKNLPMKDSNVLVDKKARRAYFVGSTPPITMHSAWLGFPRRERVHMVHEHAAEVIPVAGTEDNKKKRMNSDQLNKLEDLELFREVQRHQAGDVEPQHARVLSYGVILLIVLFAAALSLNAGKILGYL